MGGFGNVFNPKKKVASTTPRANTQTPGSNWEAVFNGKVNRPQNWGKYTQVMRENPGAQAKDVREFVNSGTFAAVNAPRAVTPMPQLPGNGGGGGGGGYGGGGGGGGGGVDPAIAAQAQLDYLTQLLAGKSYTAAPMQGMRDANNLLRTRIGEATAQDQAAATGAYNTLDQWLAQNQRNPYADVKLVAAQRAPSQNPYLASQGVQGLAEPATNPEDGGMGAFQNVLALLGANQQAGQQSRAAESQMGRTFTGQQIGAMDNAYLANVDTRDAEVARLEAEKQAALDTERRQAAMQLAELIGLGAKAPDLAALGLA